MAGEVAPTFATVEGSTPPLDKLSFSNFAGLTYYATPVLTMF